MCYLLSFQVQNSTSYYKKPLFAVMGHRNKLSKDCFLYIAPQGLLADRRRKASGLDLRGFEVKSVTCCFGYGFILRKALLTRLRHHVGRELLLHCRVETPLSAVVGSCFVG